MPKNSRLMGTRKPDAENDVCLRFGKLGGFSVFVFSLCVVTLWAGIGAQFFAELRPVLFVQACPLARFSLRCRARQFAFIG